MKWVVALPFAIAISAPAVAERDFCADRPGMDTPACTLEPGRTQIELGLGDWTLDRTGTTRTDTFSAFQPLLRFGLDSRTETQIGWAVYGHTREKDRINATTDRISGVGDVSIAIRHNLANPDGSGLSIAIQPFATLPAGNSAIGDGDWGAGLIAPVTLDLSDTINLGIMPQVNAAVDDDRDGRHLSFGSVVSLGIDVSDAVSTTIELSGFRDQDPDGYTTQSRAGLSFGWQPANDIQFDIGANAGLNQDTPDIELYFGLSRRF